MNFKRGVAGCPRRRGSRALLGNSGEGIKEIRTFGKEVIVLSVIVLCGNAFPSKKINAKTNAANEHFCHIKNSECELSNAEFTANRRVSFMTNFTRSATLGKQFFFQFTIFLILLFSILAHSATSVDKQLKSNTEALKKMERDMKRAEERVRALENQESGVLKTIAEIDNGLTATREYLEVLQKRENALASNIKAIEKEIGDLQKNIDEQKTAMTTRIRDLYIHGKREEWELLYNLLKENENPERKFYWVQRLLESDKNAVDAYLALIEMQKAKQDQLGARMQEMAVLHTNKSQEESKLSNQLLFQNEVLSKVKKDKSTQQKAISEYKKNQQTLAALIAALEKKRQAEIKRQQELARKKAEEEEKKRKAAGAKSSAKAKTPAKGKVAVPKETPQAVGPKCAPLNGAIISNYGYHINKDLDIKIMHLGTEIRGQKGAPVKAAAAGVVVMTANLPGHGPSVIIDHAGTYYTVYGHLSAIKVKEGDKVSNCAVIGAVGNAESTNGYKLFFQVYKGTQTQDPMQWLKK